MFEDFVTGGRVMVGLHSPALPAAETCSAAVAAVKSTSSLVPSGLRLKPVYVIRIKKGTGYAVHSVGLYRKVKFSSQ